MVVVDGGTNGLTSAPGAEASPGARVLDAALACVARWGVAKTTLDDVAREAGCSRAAVYRLFPGGKGSMFEAVGQREVARLLLEVTRPMEAAADVEEMLVAAIHAAASFVDENEALQTLVRHEPEQLLPYLAFDRVGPLLDACRAFLAPALARHLGEPTAGEVVEWAARLVLSYTFTPSLSIDLTNRDDVARLVADHLLPGIATATDPHQSCPERNPA